jgi:hypothetical protein
MPQHILFLYFLHCSICHPARRDNTNPYALPQLRSFSVIPSIISANFWLIVAFFDQTAAT